VVGEGVVGEGVMGGTHRKVRAARLGGVELCAQTTTLAKCLQTGMAVEMAGGAEAYVGLDGEPDATADDAIAVTAAQAGRHARDALIRHALKQADVEADLVPFHRCPNCQKQTRSLDVCSGTALRTGTMLRAGARTDLHKRQGDLRVPLLGRLEDEVVQGLADLRVLAVVLQGKQA